jgi:tetratricopeptide (TPR) repeat protein
MKAWTGWKTLLLAAVFAVAWARPAPAQSTDALAATRQAANTAYQSQDWNAAARAYEEITAKEPGNPNAWYRLAYSRQHLGQYEKALEAYAQAEKNGLSGLPVLHYNKACALARLGRKEDAITALNAAVQAGFNQPNQLDADEDLASLRGDARLTIVRKGAERNANPCGDQEYRQFDFWVGEWNVFVNGQQVATSSIQNILNGCVIFENWNPATGNGGKSFNYYDPGVKKWRQIWVSGRPGSAINFVGEGNGKTMQMTCEIPGTNGGPASLCRMTWTDLGGNKVRQLWEQSTDHGKTWTAAFDGEYRRKP